MRYSQTAVVIGVLGASYSISAIAQRTVYASVAQSAADPKRQSAVVLDARRHGPEILIFSGVKTGDKVIDLIPGGGYWTRLFASAVGASGRVYGIWPNEYLKFDDGLSAPYRAMVRGFSNVSVLEQPATLLSAPEKVDIVFTSQNYHDYGNKFMGSLDPSVLNDAVYKALKPGGIYLVIDHVAAAGSGHRDTEVLHRIDPEAVKREAAAAGFRFLGASAILRSGSDDHSRKVFDPTISGKTDQFVFKFQKPLKLKSH